MFASQKARLVVKRFAPEALGQTSCHWVLYGTTGIRIAASFHGFSGEVRFLGLSGCFLNVLSSGRSCFSRAPDPAQTPGPAPRLRLQLYCSCPGHASQPQRKRNAAGGGKFPTHWSPRFFLGLSRLRSLFSGSSGFSTRTVPASSFSPSGFEDLSRDLGLFLGRRSHRGMLVAYAPPDFSADSVENTFRSSPWIGGPCSPGGDTADYPGCAPRWLLRGGAGPGWGPAGVCGSGPRTAQLGRSVLAGEGHVQFEREDREAQWREAGRVRVRHLPGEGRAGPAPRRRVLPTPAPVPPTRASPLPRHESPGCCPPGGVSSPAHVPLPRRRVSSPISCAPHPLSPGSVSPPPPPPAGVPARVTPVEVGDTRPGGAHEWRRARTWVDRGPPAGRAGH